MANVQEFMKSQTNRFRRLRLISKTENSLDAVKQCLKLPSAHIEENYRQTLLKTVETHETWLNKLLAEIDSSRI